MLHVSSFMFKKTAFIFAILGVLAVAAFTDATEFTSTDFQVLDPVLEPAGYSTSDGFQLFGTLGQIAIATSSITSFNLAGGFLFFPTTTPPTGVSATAGNGEVNLSWTAGSAVLGWTVGGYNVGKSTASGGPYTYTSVGNVTSKTMTGLTNGTTYYFVIRNEDSLSPSNSIATSTQVSATPIAPSSSPSPTCGDGSCNGSETCSTCSTDCGVCGSGGGGGGGGGGGAPSIPYQGGINLIFKGRAYPAASITILKDGSTLKTPAADSQGNFIAESTVAGGIYTFSLYAIDNQNRRSLTTSFTANIPADKTTTFSDIVIAPTIGADKSQVKTGSDIQFFGYAYPQSQMNVIINSEDKIYATTSSDRLGLWLYKINSGLLERGDHTTKSQTVTPDAMISPFSESLAFRIGDIDVPFGQIIRRPPSAPAIPACNKNGDINNDKKVNIVDFSIMLFFWNQRSPANPCADINGDGQVNLFDFSIMLFWWTG